MPRPGSVKSLEHLCGRTISNNMDKLFGSSSSSSCPGRGTSSSEDTNNNSDGEDELLPSWLAFPILEDAKNNPRLKDKTLLALLISSDLDTLDLPQCKTLGLQSKFDKETVLHLLHTAALRHSPLKSLGFTLDGSVPSLIFKDLLPAFPNLIKLDVSYSSKESIDDDFLALLATHCLKLEDLSLIDCTGMTDVGIQKLCGHHDGTGGVEGGCKSLLRLNVEGTRVTDVGMEHLCGFKDAETGGVDGGCKSLVWLNVYGTRVTRRGARLALENLHRLQFFHQPSTLQIAAEMYRTDRTGQLSRLKNLNAERSLTLSGYGEVAYVRGSWINALRLCPSVVHVSMSRIHNLADEDLRSLLHLKCLNSLTIENCHGISFNDGVLPILQKFGPSSLESLNLSLVGEVNIGFIVEFCSNLRKIHLDRILRYSPEARQGLRPSPPHRLPHLRLLTMKGYDPELPAHQPSTADLSLLLSSAPAVEGIGLHCLLRLNDGILEEVIALHGFPDLKSFSVERCPGITKGVVDLLLELDNPLSLISIEKNQRDGSCRAKDPRLFHDPAWKEKNLDVTIRYCECIEN